jgi:hypothetical protein
VLKIPSAVAGEQHSEAARLRKTGVGDVEAAFPSNGVHPDSLAYEYECRGLRGGWGAENGCGSSCSYPYLGLIRTVCRHALAKVQACPRAAACLGKPRGGNYDGQSPA